MNKRILFVLSIVLILVLIGCNSEGNIEKQNSNNLSGEISAELQTYPFDEAVEEADLIAEVIIQEKILEFEVGPMPATVYTAKIEDKYLGNTELNEIKIMQQGTSEWRFNNNRLFERNDRLILIMKSAVNKNADYWVLGEETGMYQVLDSNKIVKLAKTDEQLKGIQIDNVESSVKSRIKQGFGVNKQILNREKFIEKIVEAKRGDSQ